MMHPVLNHYQDMTRRHFLGQAGYGIGTLALSSLLGEQVRAGEINGLDETGPSDLHFPPKIRRVISLHMAGSPPQQDLFEYKPVLTELDGQPCPDSLFENERFAFIKGHPKMLATPYEFSQCGSQGTWVSELLPHFREIADEVTIIRSMHTDQFNHAPAQMFLYTGSPLFGRPSMGSWLTWGLGSESEDLPGFIVLVSGGKVPSSGKSVWGSGFLPSVHQGVQCRSGRDPVLYVTDPDGVDRKVRRRSLDTLRELNEIRASEHGDPETLARIAQYEMAFRMQISVPDVMDISNESPEVLAEYGTEDGKPGFAANCLLARRLVEKGVRFVQLFDWGWDTHGTATHDDIVHQLPLKCRQTDRPIAALVKDLRRRGLLEDTLVIWSGEFGRTPMNEERNGSKFLGRDHHPHCYTMWMAGGGVRAGFDYGQTDDFSAHVIENPVGVHDLQATILHLLGIDHTRLTYRFQGRDFRLTDVFGNVVHDILT